jgi:hypothetical protein
MALDTPRSRWSRRAAAAFFVSLGALSSWAAPARTSILLSVQGCNTRCQMSQTDCALRCEGEIACIQSCQRMADSCVERCQTQVK